MIQKKINIFSQGVGGISLEEFYFFEKILSHFKPKTIFLLGVAAGWSTLSLGLISQSSLLLAMDNCSEGEDAIKGLNLTKRIAKKLGINLKIFKGTSPKDVPAFLNAYNKDVGLAFIDGLHTNKQIVLG